MCRNVYSIHTDHLGTPKQITDQNQEVIPLGKQSLLIVKTTLPSI